MKDFLIALGYGAIAFLFVYLFIVSSLATDSKLAVANHVQTEARP